MLTLINVANYISDLNLGFRRGHVGIVVNQNEILTKRCGNLLQKKTNKSNSSD